jgi:drug/metabolite transporter (DMT)-like permease
MPAQPSRVRRAAAFAAIYFVWGSTYLAIRIAIGSMPPFLMAGTRHLIAGLVLYGWLRARGTAAPTRRNWIAGAVIGVLLLACGNGAVVWAEQRVPSGLAALIVAMVPVWMVVVEWLRPGGRTPRGGVVIGLAVGLIGVGLMVAPGRIAGGGRVDAIGAMVLMFGSIAWSIGSVYSKKLPLPDSPQLATAVEMLAGGMTLLIGGALTGELRGFHPSTVTPASALALLYLIVFGSFIGFSAYVWLLRVSTPARVSTYAYVNPAVAVFIGWSLAGEPLSPRTLLAAGIIVSAVVLITSTSTRPAPLGASDRP